MPNKTCTPDCRPNPNATTASIYGNGRWEINNQLATARNRKQWISEDVPTGISANECLWPSQEQTLRNDELFTTWEWERDLDDCESDEPFSFSKSQKCLNLEIVRSLVTDLIKNNWTWWTSVDHINCIIDRFDVIFSGLINAIWNFKIFTIHHAPVYHEQFIVCCQKSSRSASGVVLCRVRNHFL